MLTLTAYRATHRKGLMRTVFQLTLENVGGTLMGETFLLGVVSRLSDLGVVGVNAVRGSRSGDRPRDGLLVLGGVGEADSS